MELLPATCGEHGEQLTVLPHPRYVDCGVCHTQCPFLVGTAQPTASAQRILCRKAAPVWTRVDI